MVWGFYYFFYHSQRTSSLLPTPSSCGHNHHQHLETVEFDDACCPSNDQSQQQQNYLDATQSAHLQYHHYQLSPYDGQTNRSIEQRPLRRSFSKSLPLDVNNDSPSWPALPFSKVE